MPNKGWVSLSRKVLDHYLWKDKPFSKGQAWIDLILLANHEDVTILQGDSLKQYAKGTVCRSILSLSERWGWDRKKTKRFLGVLEADQMVSVNSTTQGTTITLLNYSIYNDIGTTEDTTQGTTTPSTTPHKQQLEPLKQEEKRDIKAIRHKYGEYKNVLLSDEEVEKLKNEFPNLWEDKLEALSVYMKIHSRSYRSHYATIRAWIKKDIKEKGVNDSNVIEDRGVTFELEEFL